MYEVDFGKGTATECHVTERGKVKMHNFMLFLDSKGAYVKTHNGDVYMTPENSKII
jgi:hypothetical protein